MSERDSYGVVATSRLPGVRPFRNAICPRRYLRKSSAPGGYCSGRSRSEFRSGCPRLTCRPAHLSVGACRCGRESGPTHPEILPVGTHRRGLARCGFNGSADCRCEINVASRTEACLSMGHAHTLSRETHSRRYVTTDGVGVAHIRMGHFDIKCASFVGH